MRSFRLLFPILPPIYAAHERGVFASTARFLCIARLPCTVAKQPPPLRITARHDVISTGLPIPGRETVVDNANEQLIFRLRDGRCHCSNPNRFAGRGGHVIWPR